MCIYIHIFIYIYLYINVQKFACNMTNTLSSNNSAWNPEAEVKNFTPVLSL